VLAKARATWSVMMLLVAAVALGADCGGNGSGGLGTVGDRVTLGAPCDVGTSITTPSILAVNPAAPECSSRICLFPAQERTTPTGPFCTATCLSDDDCAKGQGRGSAPGDRRCQEGFVCRTLLPKLENNPLSCKALCVCRDFLSSNALNTRPTSCP
jgi:hypothetical protein